MTSTEHRQGFIRRNTLHIVLSESLVLWRKLTADWLVKFISLDWVFRHFSGPTARRVDLWTTEYSLLPPPHPPTHPPTPPSPDTLAFSVPSSLPHQRRFVDVSACMFVAASEERCDTNRQTDRTDMYPRGTQSRTSQSG